MPLIFFSRILRSEALVYKSYFFRRAIFGNYSTLDSYTNTAISHTFAYLSRWCRNPWQSLYNPLLKLLSHNFHHSSCSHVLGNKKVHAYYVPSRKKQAQFYERLAWDKALQWEKRQQMGSNRKKLIVESEVSRAVAWRGGKGGRAWRHAFKAAVPWYQILVSCSDWSSVFMLTDLWFCWQYHPLSISRSYNSGKDFLKHGFRASNTNFFARLFTYPSAPRKAKNIPVICFKKKKKHSKYGAFLTLFCDKLRSHLQSNWLINRRSKGTVL